MNWFENVPNTVISRDVAIIYERKIRPSSKQREAWRAASLASITYTAIPRIRRIKRMLFLDICAFYRRLLNMRKIQFVTIRLSKADKPAFKTYFASVVDDYEMLMHQLVNQGYKVSLSYDPVANCYISAVTGTEEALDNKNSCFTSRAEDPAECIVLSLYKHYELAKSGNWESLATTSDNWG